MSATIFLRRLWKMPPLTTTIGQPNYPLVSDFLPPSPPGEKATTSQDQAGQTCADNGTRYLNIRPKRYHINNSTARGRARSAPNHPESGLLTPALIEFTRGGIRTTANPILRREKQ